MKKAKFTSLLLIVAMLATMALSACSPAPAPVESPSAPPATNAPEAPATQAPETPPAEEAKPVRMLSAVTGGKDEDEMKLWAEALSKAVGFEVIIERPASDYGSVMMQKLKSDEKFDLLYMGLDTVAELVEQGALMDLTDMVAASPILSDPANIDPAEWEAVRIDGKIYSGFNKKEVHRLVNINKVIAEKAGIDVTKIEPTLDGYYEVFKAMKAASGDAAFYGLDAVIKDAWDLQPWFSSVGLKAGIVLDENGKATVPYASDEAIPVWEWLAKLYKEDLLDPDALTDGSKEMRNKFQSGQLAVVTDWAAWTGLYNANAGDQYPAAFEAFPLPGVEGPNGYMLARGGPSLWAVPVNAGNPEGAIKVLEYFATQEGGDLLSIGIEGHDYTVENGKVVLTEVGETHGKDHGAPVPISEKFTSKVGWNPGFEEAMKHIKYATPELSSPDNGKYKEIVGKYSTQIINGSMSAADGVKAMRDELKQAGVTE